MAEDLKVKFGNDEMILWRDLIEARKIDKKNSENNLISFRAVLTMAEEKFKKAKKEFNKK